MAEVGVSGIKVKMEKMFTMQQYACMNTSILTQLHIGVIICVPCGPLSFFIVNNSTILGGNFTAFSNIIKKQYLSFFNNICQ